MAFAMGGMDYGKGGALSGSPTRGTYAVIPPSPSQGKYTPYTYEGVLPAGPTSPSQGKDRPNPYQQGAGTPPASSRDSGVRSASSTALAGLASGMSGGGASFGGTPSMAPPPNRPPLNLPPLSMPPSTAPPPTLAETASPVMQGLQHVADPGPDPSTNMLNAIQGLRQGIGQRIPPQSSKILTPRMY